MGRLVLFLAASGLVCSLVGCSSEPEVKVDKETNQKYEQQAKNAWTPEQIAKFKEVKEKEDNSK